MISVTVAAQGKPKRLFGANLKVYGSGRVPIFVLEKTIDTTAEKKRWKFFQICDKIFELLLFFIGLYFPLTRASNKQLLNNRSKIEFISAVDCCDDQILFNIFKQLDSTNVLICKLVCRKWEKCIEKYAFQLTRQKIDQIRILLDEGEVFIYSIDEKKTPKQHFVPPLEILKKCLMHLTTQSLVIRGMIPIESELVMKMLMSIDLQPQQMFFIWSNFSPSSIILFEKVIKKNSPFLTDFGLEECSLNNLPIDRLFLPVIKSLISLRLWNSEKISSSGIRNSAILTINKILMADLRIETIDLGRCFITTEAVVSLIKVWKSVPETDLTLMLNNCYPVEINDIVDQLLENGITLIKKRYIFSQSKRFTLVC